MLDGLLLKAQLGKLLSPDSLEDSLWLTIRVGGEALLYKLSLYDVLVVFELYHQVPAEKQLLKQVTLLVKGLISLVN